MLIFKGMLLLFLILCALITCLHKRILVSIIIFMSYSLIMSVIWALLESPDLAITEAAVGAGVTSILFFVTLKKIHAMEKEVKVEKGFQPLELKAAKSRRGENNREKRKS